MAVYHLSAKEFSRGKGHSAVAAAAYRARCELTDERTGLKHDYSRKAGELLFSGIYAPKDAPDWARDRASLWNHVEAFEKHRRATLAREFEIALPAELTLEQNRYALQDWIRENFTRKGLIADAVIHAPSKDGDQRNMHAHVMVVMRKLDGTEFVRAKERFETYTEKDEARKAELIGLRQSWAHIGNRHLQRHGHAPSLDWRSLLEQGSDRVPTIHQGKEATALERKGKVSELGSVNREIEAANARVIDLAAEREKRQEATQTPEQVQGTDAPAKSQTPSQAPEIASSVDAQPPFWRQAWTTPTDRKILEAAKTVGDDCEKFAAELAKEGIGLARVTATDLAALDALRKDEAISAAADPSHQVRQFAHVEAGELVAVDKRGTIHRLNQQHMDRVEILRGPQPELPSVVDVRTSFEIAAQEAADFQQTMIDIQLARRDEKTQERVQAFENSQAEAADRAIDRELNTAANEAERGVGKIFSGLETALSRAIDAIAAPLEGITKFFGDMFSAPKKVTREEVKAAEQVREEKQEEAAWVLTAEQQEARFRELQEQMAKQARYSFIRDRDRGRDDDLERGLERER